MCNNSYCALCGVSEYVHVVLVLVETHVFVVATIITRLNFSEMFCGHCLQSNHDLVNDKVCLFALKRAIA